MEKQFYENMGNGTFGVPDGTFCTVTVGNLSNMTAAYTFGDGSVTNVIGGTSFVVLMGTENVKVVFTAEDGYMLDKTEIAIQSPLIGDYTLAAADLPTATNVFTLNVPADGATVALYTANQKKYFALTGEAIKTKYTGFDPSMRDRYLHPSVTLSWMGANGAVTVCVKRQGGRVLVSKELVAGTESLAVYNLEVGAAYTWTVTDAEGASASASFTTEAQAPRILNGDQIPSVRDLGGWVGLQGIHVKQGELVRTAHLDDESTGASLLTDTSRDTFLNVIGVKTELDFRSSTELAKIGRDSSSKLGATVTRYCYPVPSYALGDFAPGEDKPYGYFALAFQRVFDSGSRPLAFHGKIGRDRTGTFAALILSLLGVSEDDILREYRIAGDFSTSSSFHIDEVITALKTEFPAATLAASAKRYFTEAVGFTADEVEQFRAEMLPGYEPEDDPTPGEYVRTIGVCSWSWHEPMTNIIRRMEANGFKGIQLALSPWVWEGEGSAAQKETFGDQEGEEVFNLISNKFARGELAIHATMICFSNEDYTTEHTISNTCGFYYGLAPSATDEQQALADLTWEIRSNQFAKAVERTRALGVRNITAHIGLSEYDDANMSRLYWACKTCRENGCKLLVETGMYSAERTVAALKRFTELHPDVEIGLNFDTANQILYGADNPTNAYAVMKSWIEQVHIKDCVETYSARGSWATDVEWGRGDVSRTYDMISVLKEDGFTGPMLVEHESGSSDPDVREREILTAVKAIRGEPAPVSAGLGEVLGPYLTAEAAAKAVQDTAFTPSAEVAAVFGADAEAKAAYCAKFGFAVVPTSGGQWAVLAFLKPEAWSNVVESAHSATRQIDVAGIAALELGVPTDVTVTNCVPGFYYTIYGGSTVTNLKSFVSEKSRNVLCEPDKPVKFSEVVKPSDAAGFFTIGVLVAPGAWCGCGEDAAEATSGSSR